MDKKISKNFFLISFLPAIAYWYLEENYPVHIAISAGLILAVIEIVLEKYFTNHVHTLSKFNFFLILFLGALSLLGDDGIWFKLQPSFTGLAIGGFLIFRLMKGKGMLLEMLDSLNPSHRPPPFIVEGMEKHMSIFFIGYGGFMAYVAKFFTTDQWLFFKTLGFYIIFGVFFAFEFVWIRMSMKRYIDRMKKAEVLSQTSVRRF